MEKWKNIVQEWQDISLENYKFIFERCEKRFDEILSESESIANKSIKLLSAVVLSIGFFTTVKFDNLCLCLITFLFILYSVDIFLLVKLLFPKNIICKGSPPKEIFHRGIEVAPDNSPLTKEEKLVVVYYSELLRIQQGIDKNTIQNHNRHLLYMASILLSAIILIADVFTYIISNHP